MKLNKEIFDIINDSLIGVSCSNCHNENTCPFKRGGICEDWAISDELSDYITNRIIRTIEEKLR